MLHLAYKRYIIKYYRNDLKDSLKLCKEYDFIVKQHVLKTRVNQLSWLYFKPIFKNQLKFMFKYGHSAETFKSQLSFRTKVIENYIKYFKKDIYDLVEQYQ